MNLFILLCSNLGKVSLRPVRPCSSDAASHACHVRRGAQAAPSVGPCGTGACLYKLVLSNTSPLRYDIHNVFW